MYFLRGDMRKVTALTLLLGVGWLVLVAITLRGTVEMGLVTGLYTFVGDFAHPWRAQFHSDLSLNVFLIALWLLYRARSWQVGLLWGLLALMAGGLFTLPYVVIAMIRAKGDWRVLLLGRQARLSAPLES